MQFAVDAYRLEAKVFKKLICQMASFNSTRLFKIEIFYQRDIVCLVFELVRHRVRFNFTRSDRTRWKSACKREYEDENESSGPG